MKFMYSFLYIFSTTILIFILCEENLYDVLSVSKSASQNDIRKAYKTLAKEWHPDKNKNPEANERFIKINEAYETLSDENKREYYDRYGATLSQNNQMHEHADSFNQFHFGGSTFHFHFTNFRQGSSPFAKHNINYKVFEDRIIHESFKDATIIYAYVDYCMMCHQLAPIWQEFTSDLDKIGIGVGTLNANHDSRLTNKLGINSVPAMFGIISGKIKKFNSDFNIKNLRDFSRNLYPINLIIELSEDNFGLFMNSSSVENKILILIFDTRKLPSLRYLATAFCFRNFAKAAHINIDRFKGNSKVLSQYRISKYFEHFMIFKEDIEEPAAQIRMDMIPRSTLNEVIEANKFLNFPRISNQLVFDHVCPIQQNTHIIKICILLLLRNTLTDLKFKDFFYEHLKYNKLNVEQVKFAYVSDYSQSNLVHLITQGQGVANDPVNLRKVIIIKRSNKKLELDTLNPGWPSDNDDVFDASQIWLSLEDLTNKYLNRYSFPVIAQMNFLIKDENENIILNIMLKLEDWKKNLMDYLYNFDEWTMVAIVLTIIFVIMIAFIFKMMDSSTDPSCNINNRKPQNSFRTDIIDKSQRIKISVLNEQTYNEIFNIQLKSTRFLILILNEQEGSERSSLYIRKFVDVLAPYIRIAENLRFLIFYINGNKSFLTQLLSQNQKSSRTYESLTWHQFVGSVLVINPAKKYFHLYLSARRKVSGDFLGLDDDDFDSSQVLDNFANFIDHMLEGTLERYSFHHWPALY